MKIFRAAMLAVVCVGSAFAQEPTPTFDVTLTWTPPTTREDGSVLPPEEIDGYNIYYGTANGGPYPNKIFVDGAEVNTFIVSNEVIAGNTEYCFVATTLDTRAVESVFSNQTCKTSPSTARPGAPVLMEVTIRLNAE